MTNIFGILWFEDDTTWFTMESKIITRQLNETYGFQTIIDRENGADYSPEILKSENKYDLILMDYKLAAGHTGEKIVDLIRNNAVLTDVILYSSQYDEMVSALKNSSPLIDGVFFADRKGELFANKLFAVINKIVRRSEDIVNLRGFFLDNTSDFELRIKELLKLSWDKLPQHRNALKDEMVSVLDNSLSAKRVDIETVKGAPDVFNAANNETERIIISISGRLKILNKIIDILIGNNLISIPQDYNTLHNFRKQYSAEISAYRNALSHKKYSETSILVNRKIVKVDQALHQKLRERITKYDTLLQYLENSIAAL